MVCLSSALKRLGRSAFRVFVRSDFVFLSGSGFEVSAGNGSFLHSVDCWS